VNNGRKTKTNRRRGTGSNSSISGVSTTVTETDDDIHLDLEYDDDSIFYAAAVNAFAHSQADNKSLWSLYYHACEEYGV
jgi:hypothetical protein